MSGLRRVLRAGLFAALGLLPALSPALHGHAFVEDRPGIESAPERAAPAHDCALCRLLRMGGEPHAASVPAALAPGAPGAHRLPGCELSAEGGAPGGHGIRGPPGAGA